MSVIIMGPRCWAVLDKFPQQQHLVAWQNLPACCTDSPFGVASCSSSSTALLFLVWATTLTYVLFAFGPHSLSLGHFLVLCRSAVLLLWTMSSGFNEKKRKKTKRLQQSPLHLEVSSLVRTQPYQGALLALVSSSSSKSKLPGWSPGQQQREGHFVWMTFSTFQTLTRFYLYFNIGKLERCICSFSFLTTSCLQSSVRQGNIVRNKSSARCGRKC